MPRRIAGTGGLGRDGRQDDPRPGEQDQDGERQAPVTLADVPSWTPASKALATELKRRGFAFAGPVTAYATLQSCGIVNDHLVGCICRVSAPVDTSR